jgi:hypothetical protein
MSVNVDVVCLFYAGNDHFGDFCGWRSHFRGAGAGDRFGGF